MHRKNLALVMLSLSEGNPYSPVQIQKALFLAMKNVPHLIDNGPKYEFVPYDYGPFDASVYNDLRELQQEGFAEIFVAFHGRWNEYCATMDGLDRAKELKTEVDEENLAYLSQLSSWVRSLSFSQLVSAIYKAYPEMKAKSIFVE